jgi:solute carrier family 24 (sodium/potassium/calcium exchanger), member 6
VLLVPLRTDAYCFRPVLSNLLIFLWIVVLCGILKVVADRFFCPALEVLSDFFKLPANVAGATLLSLGNGAPDVFTQLAAVSGVRQVLFQQQ